MTKSVSEGGSSARRRRWAHAAARAWGIGLLVVASLVFGSGTPVISQNARAAITVAPVISAEPGTQAALTVGIGLPESLPKGSFIRIRGLPPMVALSEGYSISPGSWAVPISALPNLKLTLPGSAAGKSEISIILVSMDGSVLAEAKSTVVIAAPPMPTHGIGRNKTGAPAATILRAGTPEPASPERIEPPLTSAPPALRPAMTGEQRDRALRLVGRGNEHLAEGGIAQARLLYERAAEAGLPEGAMAMAATYDPVELQQLGVQGLKPDRADAQRWYEKARQLGAPGADQRLRRLSVNGGR